MGNRLAEPGTAPETMRNGVRLTGCLPRDDQNRFLYIVSTNRDESTNVLSQKSVCTRSRAHEGSGHPRSRGLSFVDCPPDPTEEGDSPRRTVPAGRRALLYSKSHDSGHRALAVESVSQCANELLGRDTNLDGLDFRGQLRYPVSLDFSLCLPRTPCRTSPTSSDSPISTKRS